MNGQSFIEKDLSVIDCFLSRSSGISREHTNTIPQDLLYNLTKNDNSKYPNITNIIDNNNFTTPTDQSENNNTTNKKTRSKEEGGGGGYRRIKLGNEGSEKTHSRVHRDVGNRRKMNAPSFSAPGVKGSYGCEEASHVGNGDDRFTEIFRQ